MSEEKPCILAIDDAAMQLHAIVKILQPTYNVKVAKSGEEGLEFVHKYDIDLILLDMVMPGLSGIDVLVALKGSSKTKHIPVILVTGNSSTEDKIRGFSLGASDYIVKPFNADIVTKKVAQLLRMK